MGKAVPRGIKSKAIIIFEEYQDKCSTNFEKNKELIREIGLSFSPVNRNLIAGYIGRLVEAKKKEDMKGKVSLVQKAAPAAAQTA